MKTRTIAMFILLIAVVFLMPTPSMAQGGDASVYIKMSHGGGAPQVIPWMSYDTGKVYLECRANFDWKDASTILIGKSFQTKSFTMVPQVGMIWGSDYDAITPEVYTWGSKGKFSWMALNQISFGLSSESPSFAYHWVESTYKVRDWITVGVSEQVYWEYSTNGADPALDIGPVLKFMAYKSYVKLWGTIDPSDSETRKFFIGIGTAL